MLSVWFVFLVGTFERLHYCIHFLFLSITLCLSVCFILLQILPNFLQRYLNNAVYGVNIRTSQKSFVVDQ